MGRKQDSAQYRGFRNAGIRLTEELLPHLVSHRTERINDILPGIHAFDKAHLVMLVEEGLIPRAAGVAMLRELRGTEAEGFEKTRFANQGGVHSAEQLLIRKLGEEIGGQLHLGRSTGDLDEVGRRFAVRQHLLDLIGALNPLRRTLLDRAREHADTVMPGYTQGQHAQPTTFGHWLSMWANVFARDVARFRALYERVNLSPAGAAIMTGSDFPLNRQRTCDLLGFAASIPHTLDAIMSHDIELETASLLAIYASNMARLGDDLMLWTSSEFRMVDVPDRFCGTSSIMMQKKNPYAPQEMKALAVEAVGGAMTAFMVEKDPTGVAILERRRTERSFWSVFAGALRRAQDAREIIEALIVDRAHMRELAGAYWGQGADLAGMLVRERKLPWRSAHQIVGILVRLTYERGLKPADVTPALLDEAAIEYMDKPLGIGAAKIAEAVDPAACVARRTLYGGPAPASAVRELAIFSEALDRDEQLLGERKAGVENAARKLEAAIDALVA
ncbi:MAG: argininosuccinate lyase [Proteobacteria bacterium]|nr:argininosuccinate lyase [Pseudomonadota bacterium]